MRNAKKYDERITIGEVPDSEDLAQLREIGYRTLVDLRDEEEKFGGYVEKRARALELAYISVPIVREAITLEDVKRFFEAVLAKGGEPYYVFSRFGKRPLALLLLLEAGILSEHASAVFRKASGFGLNLDGDLTLQQFIVDFLNSGDLGALVEFAGEIAPEFVEETRRRAATRAASRPAVRERDPIALALREAAEGWAGKRDGAVLRDTLADILRRIDGPSGAR